MIRVRNVSLAVALLAGLTRSAAAQPPDAADALFNDRVVHEIRLAINARDWQDLQLHWQDDDHYPADFRWNDQVVRNVSMKSHGGGSRRPNKMSFKIGFNHYTAGQTFLGLQSILLRNNSQDPTNMRERLSMLVFRNLGVAKSREAHTRLYVNDQYYGLFTIVEEFDTDFLQKNLGENTGRLYEYRFDNVAALAGNPPFVFQYLGSDPARYVPNLFEPKTPQTETDPQGGAIARFFQNVGDTGAAAWRTNVSAFLDLPRFIRHLAIENFLGEEDGLTGDFGPNNFYLYRFANTTVFRFLPWDKSETFWDAPSPDYDIFRNVVNGPEDHRSLLVLRAFQEPDLLALYFDTLLECAAFADQGATSEQPGWLETEVNREYSQIRAAALDDTILVSNDQFEQAVVDLRAFARGRAASIRAQVAAARGQ